MKSLLVALLLLYPLSAIAQTYEWTDEHGTVNFAEDLGKVPKKYRKKAKIVGGEESGAPETTTTSEPAEPAGGKAKVERGEKTKKLYGGKDEVAWRSEFIVARGEIKATESDLAELNGRLADTSQMSRSEYLAIQNTIKHNEIRLQGQQKKLEQLNDAADRAGVPMDFRQ